MNEKERNKLIKDKQLMKDYVMKLAADNHNLSSNPEHIEEMKKIEKNLKKFEELKLKNKILNTENIRLRGLGKKKMNEKDYNDVMKVIYDNWNIDGTKLGFRSKFELIKNKLKELVK